MDTVSICIYLIWICIYNLYIYFKKRYHVYKVHLLLFVFLKNKTICATAVQAFLRFSKIGTVCLVCCHFLMRVFWPSYQLKNTNKEEPSWSHAFFLPPYPFQPRPPHHRKCTCSVSPPPASRWVGRLPRPIVVTDTSSGTRLPIRPRRVKTKNGTRCKTSRRMCPATFWRSWRNGRSTRCGSKRTLMSGPVRRAAAPASERKRTVMPGFSLLLTCSLLLLTGTPHLSELTLLPVTSLVPAFLSGTFCFLLLLLHAGLPSCCSLFFCSLVHKKKRKNKHWEKCWRIISRVSHRSAMKRLLWRKAQGMCGWSGGFVKVHIDLLWFHVLL